MPTDKNNEMNDEFIDIEEVRVSPRGRKPVLDGTLVDLLARVPRGKAAVLRKHFGVVDRDDRPAVSASIRKHWAHAQGDGVRVRIDYSPDGFVQVRHRDQ